MWPAVVSLYCPPAAILSRVLQEIALEVVLSALISPYWVGPTLAPVAPAVMRHSVATMFGRILPVAELPLSVEAVVVVLHCDHVLRPLDPVRVSAGLVPHQSVQWGWRKLLTSLLSPSVVSNYPYMGSPTHPVPKSESGSYPQTAAHYMLLRRQTYVLNVLVFLGELKLVCRSCFI